MKNINRAVLGWRSGLFSAVRAMELIEKEVEKLMYSIKNKEVK